MLGSFLYHMAVSRSLGAHCASGVGQTDMPGTGDLEGNLNNLQRILRQIRYTGPFAATRLAVGRVRACVCMYVCGCGCGYGFAWCVGFLPSKLIPCDRCYGTVPGRAFLRLSCRSFTMHCWPIRGLWRTILQHEDTSCTGRQICAS